MAEKAMDVPPKGEKAVDTFFGAWTKTRVPGCPQDITDYVETAGLYG